MTIGCHCESRRLAAIHTQRQSMTQRRSTAHEKGHQRLVAHLATPVTVDLVVKGGTFGQHVGRVEVLTRTKHTRCAVLQADFHLTAQNKHPLRVARAVEGAAKAHRAVAELVAARSHQGREAALGFAFVQGNGLVLEFGAAVGVGVEHHLGECRHVLCPGCEEAIMPYRPAGSTPKSICTFMACFLSPASLKACTASLTPTTCEMTGRRSTRPSLMNCTATANSGWKRKVPRSSSSLATSGVMGRLASGPMPTLTSTPRGATTSRPVRKARSLPEASNITSNCPLSWA